MDLIPSFYNLSQSISIGYHHLSRYRFSLSLM
nr:MAG TPA: hypothetical protein [Caudoviricetes sp.]